MTKTQFCSIDFDNMMYEKKIRHEKKKKFVHRFWPIFGGFFDKRAKTKHICVSLKNTQSFKK